MKERSCYIDILKAIGIISIVIGHSSSGLLNSFVYSYHIMIFFFVVGMCFTEDNASNPGAFIGKRILNLLKLSAKYNTFFLLIHNFLVRLNITTGFLSMREIFEALFYPLIFVYSENFLGAFWFIPMFIVGILIFAVNFSFTNKKRNKDFFNAISAIIWAAIALFMNRAGMQFAYHIQTSLLAIPLIYAGYYYSQWKGRCERWINAYGGVVAAIILLLILKYAGRIELSDNQIISVWLFYPTTLIAIYFCLCFGKVIEKTGCSNCVVLIGRNSFCIMGLHFLAFKLVDFFYCMFFNITDVTILSRFPNSGFPIDIVYWFAGVIIPLGALGVEKFVIQKYLFLRERL